MEISIFDVLGPMMIGPSSSHTAGALRLARAAACIAGKPFSKVQFGLHGSFAKTAVGHGTDRALLAGALGYTETDSSIIDIFDIATERGIAWSYYEVELPDAHENSVVITFTHLDGTKTVVIGSSIGGGQIVVTGIDGVATEFSAQYPTLLIRHRDRKGVLAAVASCIAGSNVNIAVMRSDRDARGNIATTIIETDSNIPLSTADVLRGLENVLDVRLICL